MTNLRPTSFGTTSRAMTMLASLLEILPKPRHGSPPSTPTRTVRSLLENSTMLLRQTAPLASLPSPLITTLLTLPLIKLEQKTPQKLSLLRKRNSSSTLSGFSTTMTPTRTVSSMSPRLRSSGTTSPLTTTQVNSLPKLVRSRLGLASLTPTRTAS